MTVAHWKKIFISSTLLWQTYLEEASRSLLSTLHRAKYFSSMISCTMLMNGQDLLCAQTQGKTNHARIESTSSRLLCTCKPLLNIRLPFKCVIYSRVWNEWPVYLCILKIIPHNNVLPEQLIQHARHICRRSSKHRSLWLCHISQECWLGIIMEKDSILQGVDLDTALTECSIDPGRGLNKTLTAMYNTQPTNSEQGHDVSGKEGLEEAGMS